MSGGAKVCNTVYWLALTIWVSVLVAAAIAAATTFTVLPNLGLTLDAFSALPAADHGRIAAGKVMEPIFTLVDVVQAGAAAVVLLTVVVQWLAFRCSLRRFANVVRVAAITIAAGLFAWRAATLSPAMNRELRGYWSAAEAGEVAQAAGHRAAFDGMHPRASDLFSATLGLLVIAVVASPSALAVPPVKRVHPPGPVLETPALSRRA